VTVEQDDYDGPWKDALERYLEAFMALFFPEAHGGIDWTRGHEFLDKELQQVVRDAELGRRMVDKLVKVWRKDGREAWALIHIEVQSQADPGFPKRMYVYHYRVFDRYDHPVVSLAVLGDDRSGWRPEEYGYALWGSEMRLRFPVVKLTDFLACWEVLEQSANPMAVLVMAHLKTQRTRHDPLARMRGKLELVKSLYRRNYGREDILELFRFIDWIMVLPDELREPFDRELLAYEQEAHMPYITSIERSGIEKGIEQGIQKGIQKGIQRGEAAMLARFLECKFGPLDAAVRQRLEQADEATLLRWGSRVLTAASLDEVWTEG
jgi:hypothetical protein